MKNRDSFRGTAITKAFCEAFKSTKFYTEIYQKHKNEIIIGIRDGYINLYYNCDSIAKIRVGQPSKALLASYYTDKKHVVYLTKNMFHFIIILRRKVIVEIKRRNRRRNDSLSTIIATLHLDGFVLT